MENLNFNVAREDIVGCLRKYNPNTRLEIEGRKYSPMQLIEELDKEGEVAATLYDVYPDLLKLSCLL